MKYIICLSTLFIGVILLLSFKYQGEKAVFKISGEAENEKYGYTKENPIRVGGGTTAGYHFQFLNHLMGPNGEELEIKRIGSCWEYENPDSSLTKFDKGVLTCFSINCKAYTEPKILYFDKYRWGLLYVPKYCTWKE